MTKLVTTPKNEIRTEFSPTVLSTARRSHAPHRKSAVKLALVSVCAGPYKYGQLIPVQIVEELFGENS